jgi:hypothetical protein
MVDHRRRTNFRFTSIQMNNRIEDLMYQSGLTASGCWDDMDDYAHNAIEKFAKLTVEDCIQVLVDYGYTDAASALTEAHFGPEPNWKKLEFPEI